MNVNLHGVSARDVTDKEEKHLGTFLVSFDYTKERFERLCLPCHRGTAALSVVREEKLTVLLHDANTPRTEIWVTNKD
ncbi:unnamed protein product [Arabidopsis halleri]